MEKHSTAFLFFLLFAVASSVPGAAAQPGVAFGPLESVTAAQVRNIIEALIGAGDFGNWANVLFGLDPTTLPVSSTLFIPGDEVLARINFRADFDPAVIQYHIVPIRLTFVDLRHLRAGDRLPTLLSNRTIVVTSVDPSNFTIDDTPISRPDIYNNDAVSVHGIGAILDYSRYGAFFFPKPSASSPTMPAQAVNSSPPPGDEGLIPSAVSCSHCIGYPMIPVFVICVILGFNLCET